MYIVCRIEGERKMDGYKYLGPGISTCVCTTGTTLRDTALIHVYWVHFRDSHQIVQIPNCKTLAFGQNGSRMQSERSSNQCHLSHNITNWLLS